MRALPPRVRDSESHSWCTVRVVLREEKEGKEGRRERRVGKWIRKTKQGDHLSLIRSEREAAPQTTCVFARVKSPAPLTPTLIGTWEPGGYFLNWEGKERKQSNPSLCHLAFLFCFSFVFRDRVSLCNSPGCPKTHFVDLTITEIACLCFTPECWD